MTLEDLAFPLTAQERLMQAVCNIRTVVPDTVYAPGVILAIDPGTDKSGWCLYDGSLIDCGVSENHDLLGWIRESSAAHLAIEMVASYGMPVGREVFETVRWIGRFQQAWTLPEDVALIYRRDVKLRLCGSSKAKDGNIRQALLDRFPRTGGGKTPQIGTKARPGPLYGISTHAWAALAVAVVHKANLDGANQ